MKKDNLKNQVFKETLKIPKGEVSTYAIIAKKLKTSPRAVARILSANMHPIKIPCHRVIQSGRKIGGYTFKGKFDPAMKIRLLKEEGVNIKDGKIQYFKP
jgi:methylated-DNA-[protein]-cysteine S-methyltransferase